MNDTGLCRTAPATAGLLKSVQMSDSPFILLNHLCHIRTDVEECKLFVKMFCCHYVLLSRTMWWIRTHILSSAQCPPLYRDSLGLVLRRGS